MPTKFQYVNKCVASIIPRASTFSFSRTLRNDRTSRFFAILHSLRGKNKVYEKLEYDEVSEQDDKNRLGSQHVTTFYGDSGSPFWKYDASNRAVVVSIVSSQVGPQYGPRATLMENPEMLCNEKATKLTEEIVLWIKDKAGIRRGQKRSHPGETSGTK